LLVGLHAGSTHLDTLSCAGFCPLQIDMTAASAGRVEFGCTSAVGVSTTEYRTPFTDRTCLGHKVISMIT